MKNISFLLVMIFLAVMFSNPHNAFTIPTTTPGPPTITSVIGKQMDHPAKDTITVSIGTADSTENACVKIAWLVSGYPDGVVVGNTMLVADYVPDTSYSVPEHFPENAVIYLSIWTGNISGGDTTWSDDPNTENVYLAVGSWPRYGYKHFIEELLRSDSSRVNLATSDFLMAKIEEVSDEAADKPNYEWIDEWQEIIELHPEMIRLAYVTPPFCSRALPDTMPFWHGFMSQLHSWDEDDEVCFYYESDTTSISVTSSNTDSFIVVDNRDKIEWVNSEGVGLSDTTGAVRYLHINGQREVDYILWNEWAEGGNQDTLFLLNRVDPHNHPRMGTDDVNPKVTGDQVTSFQDWGFNIVSVLVLMNANRPAIDDSVSFEDILADSSYSWIEDQAVGSGLFVKTKLKVFLRCISMLPCQS